MLESHRNSKTNNTSTMWEWVFDTTTTENDRNEKQQVKEQIYYIIQHSTKGINDNNNDFKVECEACRVCEVAGLPCMGDAEQLAQLPKSFAESQTHSEWRDRMHTEAHKLMRKKEEKLLFTVSEVGWMMERMGLFGLFAYEKHIRQLRAHKFLSTSYLLCNLSSIRSSSAFGCCCCFSLELR